MTYTPTTEQVRLLYANSMDPDGFDRWHANEIRKAKAEAWQEGYILSCQHHGGYAQCNTADPHKASRANPYTEES